MLVTLMKENQAVCDAEVQFLSLAGPIVTNFKMLCWEFFPVQDPELNSACDPSLLRAVFRWWLEGRVIPNSDPTLDKTMQEVYELNPAPYGRMYHYQYLGAFLSYMTSTKDDYWVNPQYPQYLTYALVDPHFRKLYCCEPVDYEAAKTAGGKFRKCLLHR